MPAPTAGYASCVAQIDDMRIFAAVVEAGGFRAAAQRVALPASTVSDVVRRLEDTLGVRLLHRNTRSVMPTDAGRTLLAGINPAFDLIDRAVAALHDTADEPVGRLRLTVAGIVARYILPPILARFMLAHPRIEVEVSSDDRVVDIVDAGFDAAIRYQERVARNMAAVPVGPLRQRYVAAAAPGYIARSGVPDDPASLSAHRLIGHRLSGGAIVAWEFQRGRQRKQVTPAGALVSPSIDIRVAAAIAGVGIIYTFDEVLRASLDAGTLVPLLEDWSIAFSGPVLCYHDDRHMPAPLRAFLDFLQSDVG